MPLDSYETDLQRAFAAQNAGRSAEAETLCRQLLPVRLADARLHFLLGMVLHRLARDAEAVTALQHAATLSPREAAIFNGLGCAFHSLKDFSRAVENFRQAIALKPHLADLHYSLGNSVYQLGDVEAAAAAFRRAVELNPRDAASWNNLGKTRMELNRLEESLAAYDQALAVKPDYALAHYGRALTLLAAGDLPDGFREFEWRPRRIPRAFSQPRWRGEPLAGRTIFLHAEQGFGDAIQTVRFIPQLRERGARVILECRPEQKSLFAFSRCADEVIAFGEPIPAFDFYASLVSLPGMLGVTLAAIPHRVPYLAAPAGEKLPGENPKIGVVWAGNPHHHHDAKRSLPLAELAPILQLPGKTFLSLQLPVPESDSAALKKFPGLTRLDRRMTDFLETAAVVAQLDLVIAVDTAVAHLAGALGKPVWLLLPSASDWRWFRQFGDATPWYPTMRLFRQTQRGDWTAVIARVAEALRLQKPPSGPAGCKIGS